MKKEKCPKCGSIVDTDHYVTCPECGAFLSEIIQKMSGKPPNPQKPVAGHNTTLAALNAQTLYLKEIRDTLNFFKLLVIIVIILGVVLILIGAY